ncbi:MAG: hypothetical protein M1365_01260 [Actinobacteria bacterium]|nr:hypothetical protein [Actinomycetota bacterium]
MNKNEGEKRSSREKIGRTLKWGGIIAGGIGLIAEASLLFPAVGVIVGGVIFERTGKNARVKK